MKTITTFISFLLLTCSFQHADACADKISSNRWVKPVCRASENTRSRTKTSKHIVKRSRTDKTNQPIMIIPIDPLTDEILKTLNNVEKGVHIDFFKHTRGHLGLEMVCDIFLERDASPNLLKIFRPGYEEEKQSVYSIISMGLCHKIFSSQQQPFYIVPKVIELLEEQKEKYQSNIGIQARFYIYVTCLSRMTYLDRNAADLFFQNNKLLCIHIGEEHTADFLKRQPENEIFI